MAIIDAMSQKAENYLTDLLARMAHKDEPGGPRVGWDAHREAEKSRDAALCKAAIKRLADTHAKETRQHLYFIIAKIAGNRRSSAHASVLVAASGSETDKYVLNTVHTVLGFIGFDVKADFAPVRAHLTDERWLVRHSAISALQASKSEANEDALLWVLANSKDPMDIPYAQGALNAIGTAKALPALRANLTSRKRDINVSAALAIERIERRQGVLVRLFKSWR